MERTETREERPASGRCVQRQVETVVKQMAMEAQEAQEEAQDKDITEEREGLQTREAVEATEATAERLRALTTLLEQDKAAQQPT